MLATRSVPKCKSFFDTICFLSTGTDVREARKEKNTLLRIFDLRMLYHRQIRNGENKVAKTYLQCSSIPFAKGREKRT